MPVSMKLMEENLHSRRGDLTMKKIPKDKVLSARGANIPKPGEQNRRFEQLLVKNFLKDKLGLGDNEAVYSDAEAGDDAYNKHIK